MCLVSFFPGWSQVKRTLNSRVEDCGAGGMGNDPYPEIEDVHSSRIEDCEPMPMASLHFYDYIQTTLRRIKLGWRKAKPRQKQGMRLNTYGVLRSTLQHSEVKVSLDVFQT